MPGSLVRRYSRQSPIMSWGLVATAREYGVSGSFPQFERHAEAARLPSQSASAVAATATIQRPAVLPAPHAAATATAAKASARTEKSAPSARRCRRAAMRRIYSLIREGLVALAFVLAVALPFLLLEQLVFVALAVALNAIHVFRRGVGHGRE